MLYQGGMLMAAICADYHTRGQITRNVIETVVERIVKDLRTEAMSVHTDTKSIDSVLNDSADPHKNLSVAALVLMGALSYQLILGRSGRGWWVVLIEIVLLISYFIVAAVFLRAVFGKKRVDFLTAAVLSLITFCGWFIVYRIFAGEPYSPSLLLAAALYFSFQTLRLDHPDSTPRR